MVAIHCYRVAIHGGSAPSRSSSAACGIAPRSARLSAVCHAAVRASLSPYSGRRSPISCSNHGSRSASHSSSDPNAVRRGGGCCTNHARSSSPSSVTTEDPSCDLVPHRCCCRHVKRPAPLIHCSTVLVPHVASGQTSFLSAEHADRLIGSSLLCAVLAPLLRRERDPAWHAERKGTRFAVAAEGRKYVVRYDSLHDSLWPEHY